MKRLPPSKPKSKAADSQKLAEIADRLEPLMQALPRMQEMKESGALDAAVNFSYTLKTLQDMLTDEAVANLSSASASLMELANALSRPEVRDKLVRITDNLEGVSYLAQKLDEMKRAGALDAILDIAYLVKTLKDMLTDEAVANLSGKLSSLLECLPQAIELFPLLSSKVVMSMAKAAGSEEVAKAAEDPPKVGFRSFLSSLGDEDTQRGMGVLMVLAKEVGRTLRAQ